METQIKTKKDQLWRSDKRDGDFDRGGGSDFCRRLFFSCAEPDVGEQYFGIGDRALNFIPIPVVGDHDGFKCGAFDHRI